MSAPTAPPGPPPEEPQEAVHGRVAAGAPPQAELHVGGVEGAGPQGTPPEDRLARQLAGLRAEFDRSFADPPRTEVAGHDDLLAIRAGGVRYALRLRQAAGLFPDRPVTRLPGPLGALLGVAGFRGAIVPVYDLAAVLGTRGTPAGDDLPRWLVLAAGSPPVALAFEALDGHLRIPSEGLVEETEGHGPHGCLRGIVPLPDGARPIIDVPAVRTAIEAAAGRSAAPPPTPVTGPDAAQPFGVATAPTGVAAGPDPVPLVSAAAAQAAFPPDAVSRSGGSAGHGIASTSTTDR
ncbi:chemotaxis protein CheW [Dactylosporangium sp. CA-233914]|uniref:chemotaxis protein CheW n=1 Tax=Dactylosporangium sp. CA-233914 TaxID=3239934 RepID=UPI003D8A41E5